MAAFIVEAHISIHLWAQRQEYPKALIEHKKKTVEWNGELRHEYNHSKCSSSHSQNYYES